MKENYIITAFRKTAHTQFPAQEAGLSAALDKKMQQLR